MAMRMKPTRQQRRAQHLSKTQKPYPVTLFGVWVSQRPCDW